MSVGDLATFIWAVRRVSNSAQDTARVGPVFTYYGDGFYKYFIGVTYCKKALEETSYTIQKSEIFTFVT